MTTLYEQKRALNMTLVECLPNKVSMVRTKERDGYESVQLEIAKTSRKMFRKEFRLEAGETAPEVGAAIEIGAFQVGDRVKVSGLTKARGFQGVVKRHGFGGAPKSHGRKHDWRKPGSIGSGFPEHVTKGKRMAGRMGGKRSSSLNLEVVYIDPAQNLIGLRGAVPGVAGRVVEIVTMKK